MSRCRGADTAKRRIPGRAIGWRPTYAYELIQFVLLEVVKGLPGEIDGEEAIREDQRPIAPSPHRKLAHPDHGASEKAAAGRIAELDTARRILLG